MATSILSALIGNNPYKVTDSQGLVKWKDLAIVRVDFVAEAEVTDQPLATKNAVSAEMYVDLIKVDVTNGKIIRPAKLRTRALCANLSTVEDLMTTFVDVTATFSVTSKSLISDNMIMTDLTITQSQEMLSAVEIQIEWERSAPDQTAQFSPINPANADGLAIRIQTLADSSTNAARTLVNNFTSGVNALYNKVSSKLGGSQ